MAKSRDAVTQLPVKRVLKKNC